MVTLICFECDHDWDADTPEPDARVVCPHCATTNRVIGVEIEDAQNGLIIVTLDKCPESNG